MRGEGRDALMTRLAQLLWRNGIWSLLVLPFIRDMLAPRA